MNTKTAQTCWLSEKPGNRLNKPQMRAGIIWKTAKGRANLFQALPFAVNRNLTVLIASILSLGVLLIFSTGIGFEALTGAGICAGSRLSRTLSCLT